MSDVKKHIPVLSNEVLRFLDPKPNQNFIDCTVGGGGHAKKILNLTSPRGKLLGIDWDYKAIDESEKNLSKFKYRYILVEDNFVNFKKIVKKYNFQNVDGILFDLGMSSIQLEDSSRGFSFLTDGTLDMRMDQDSKTTASDIINNWREEELVKIFKEYGEEKKAKPIAKVIVEERKKTPIIRTSHLVRLIGKVKKPIYKRHPATKIFQALRIATNNELNNLKIGITESLEVLKPKGRIAVISFHSKEDRITKQFFLKQSKECICPPKQPVCTCNHRSRLKIITKKPILPHREEIGKNPKARSAKLRVAEKI